MRFVCLIVLFISIKALIPVLKLCADFLSALCLKIRLEGLQIIIALCSGDNLKNKIIQAVAQRRIVLRIFLGRRFERKWIVHENFRCLLVCLDRNCLKACPLRLGFSYARRPLLFKLFLIRRIDIPVRIAALICKDRVDRFDASVLCIVEMNALFPDIDKQLILLLQVNPVYNIRCILRTLQNNGVLVDCLCLHKFAGSV